MITTVSRKGSFDAAHHLPGYKGKCSQVHGHHWIVEVGVTGSIGSDGFVLDFTELDTYLKNVETELDHRDLNTIPGLTNPTAENICLRLLEKFKLWTWTRPISLAFIRLWETEDSMCELRP